MVLRVTISVRLRLSLTNQLALAKKKVIALIYKRFSILTMRSCVDKLTRIPHFDQLSDDSQIFRSYELNRLFEIIYLVI